MDKKPATLKPETVKHLLAIDRQKVKSSNIHSIGYTNADTKMMTVEFVTGGIYAYTPVTLEAFHTLLQAESIGKHFTENFRKNNLVSFFKLT